MDESASASGLARLTDAVRALPPVQDWNPSVCGDINIVIRRDGAWWHDGAPIRRDALVRLFSTILRLEADGYWLVTPVEKLKITVEDAPFVAVAVEASDAGLRFTTNVGDVVTADADHPIRLRAGEAGLKPYVEVRHGLEALIARPVYYELAALAEAREGVSGVMSGEQFFPLDAEA
ncbi:DUF1285 domain-containing protein [Phenylobacterium immobile]|uniref:DUF1285 domain-containing protein n=1 Tax=Phenylobacterium immobile TaxID=21 RepID=UPI000A999C5C|nr:DUF1285 domain-containing protein [Phenylobacterium immobile]